MEELKQLPPEVVEQLLRQIEGASPWSQSVYGLIILLLLLGVLFFARLYTKAVKRSEKMAEGYLEGIKLMEGFKVRLEDTISMMREFAAVMKEGNTSQELANKTITKMDEAIDKVQEIAESLSKIVWKNEGNNKE